MRVFAVIWSWSSPAPASAAASGRWPHTIPTSGCARPRCNTSLALAGAKDETRTDLLAEALATGAPLLQLGCIAGLRADAPPALWAAAAACVTSADRDLRWAAYEAVIRHGALRAPGPELARELLNREPEQPTRRTRRSSAARARGHRRRSGSWLEDRALNAGVLPEVVEALHDA